MVKRGSEIVLGVAPDILTPRDGGGAYDDMLRGLMRTLDGSEPVANSLGDGYYGERELRSVYHHLVDARPGTSEQSYADLLRLTWPAEDWRATEGKFNRFEVYGSNPLYAVTIDVRRGLARVIDHETGTPRRVDAQRLAAMTYARHAFDYSGNRLGADGWLSRGYVVDPTTHTVNVKDDNGEVTGDSVRRSLEPYESIIGSIAHNLSTEADAQEE